MNKRRLLLPCAILALLATVAHATDRDPKPAADPKPVPKDAALLEIVAAAGTHVTIDGRDATGLAEFRYDLAKDEERESRVEARFPDGSKTTQKVLVHRGWRIPLRLTPAKTASDGLVLQAGQPSKVYAVAFSPDGQYLIAGGGDSIATLWNIRTGERIRSYATGDRFVADVKFSPDGAQVLTKPYRDAAILWRVRTGEKLHTFATDGDGCCAAFSPDGRVVAIAGYKTATLWNARSGEKLRTLSGHPDELRSLAFSPEDAQILTGSRDNTAVLWDAQTGKSVRTFSGPKGFFSASAETVAFCPNSHNILIGDPGNHGVIWDSHSGEKVLTFIGQDGCFRSAVFNRGGDRLLTVTSDFQAVLWNPQTGEIIRRFKGHDGPIQSAVFSADGQQIATGSEDATVIIWDARTGKNIRTLGERSDGSVWMASVRQWPQLFVASNHILSLWNSPDGRVFRSCKLPPGAGPPMAISLDGQTIVATTPSHSAAIWKLWSGEKLQTLAEPVAEHGNVGISRDGRQALAEKSDKTLVHWDVHSGKSVAEFFAETNSDYHLGFAEFSPDGQQVLLVYHFRFWFTGGPAAPDRAFLWDFRAGKIVGSLDLADKPYFDEKLGQKMTMLGVKCINRATISPNGKKILTDDMLGMEAILWDAATGNRISTFRDEGRPGFASIGSFSFSPDGRRVLIGYNDDRTLIWDVATQQKIRSFTGRSTGVTSVAFSPDGSQIVIGSQDGTTRLWCEPTGQELAELIVCDDGKEWLVVTPDGVFDGSENARKKYVRFRDPKDPMKVVPAEQGFQAYYHPNLLADVLAGHAVAPPAK